MGTGPILAMQISDGSEVTARRNVLHGSDQATIFIALAGSVHFEQNHILHGNGPTLDVRYYGYSGYDLDFRNNWWGTTDSTQIAEWIVDATDDPFRGETVEWWPILSHPVSAEKTSLGALKRRFGPD